MSADPVTKPFDWTQHCFDSIARYRHVGSGQLFYVVGKEVDAEKGELVVVKAVSGSEEHRYPADELLWVGC